MILKDIEEIKPFFEESQKDGYFIIDAEQRSIVAKPDSEIHHDMNVTIKKYLKPEENDQFTVVIELQSPTETDKIDFISIIVFYSGVDADTVAVKVEKDEAGKVTEVLVYTNIKDTAYKIEDFVNNNLSICSNNVCRIFKGAHVIVKPKPLGSVSRCGIATMNTLLCYLALGLQLFQ